MFIELTHSHNENKFIINTDHIMKIEMASKGIGSIIWLDNTPANISMRGGEYTIEVTEHYQAIRNAIQTVSCPVFKHL